ncbi:(2Fe-2S)-binding protein [Paraburkholderia sp. Ac-20347]|jgi:D-hydroxyproline dehydrogenase subunit gamma|uniref:(2Fe-2S)-binding protein n=1 Tax=Paraburkholderia sp. Ac-20347 TaxID=2703892 RepID=UPI00197F33A9|nr:(2Fe-2S)-binding protein [Paraburkholderia sp. Ac-20347]MBN3811935.1 (2Fe-2S)-binding protein [Paraburkholderia sp. Ac-20347]
MNGRFVRLGETARAKVSIVIDGHSVEALEGDTLLTAMLCSVRYVRQSEFGEEKRAGYCLMGACQDCWVWTDAGERLRACTTVVEAGMRLVTTQPEAQWANLAL